MDYNGLVQALQNLEVQPPDVLRASLYIDYLTAAQTYFNVTLDAVAPAGLTAAGYTFVRDAVRSSSLLNELAAILDFYVAPAVEADLQAQYAAGHGPASAAPWTYRDYFDNMILNAVPATYTANVTAFRARYPISDNALAQLAANFQRNIKTCCDRVYADRLNITLFYNDLYANTLTLTALTGIKSTGSDFHKGGKQVLILTFRGSYVQGGSLNPTAVTFKLIYKPSDVEVDCLIAGQAVAVNAVIPNGFMTNSLFEIYNAALAANPGIGGLPLRTYRILPRNYNSQHGGGAPLPIRDAYGYIQYLNYDLQWNGDGWFGFYPSAVSDYVVFATQLTAIPDFYRRAGAFCAVSMSFSIMDMHIENFRVSQYDPYPIDLELSLTTPAPAIGTTLLTGPLGGLTGEYVEGQDSNWVVRNADVAGGAYLEREYPPVYEANRLYRAEPNRQKSLVAIDNPHLFAGFDEGMQVLRAAQNAGDFIAWFTRLDNVVVRYLPYPTADFKSIITQVYINTLLGAAPGSLLLPTLTSALLNKVTGNYNAYANGNLPTFLAYQFAISGADYQNLDIPVFYYRINAGSLDIVDSSGVVVPIPATVAINGNPAAPCAARVGRAGYFPNAPMTTNVQAPQVTALGTPATYLNRYAALQQSMLTDLHLAAVPAIPQDVVPDLYL